MWKQHPIYKNYLISNTGKVKAKARTIKYPDGHTQHFRERDLHSYTSKFGYEMVKITYNKKRINKQVNDLVAETYIPNPNNLPETHHLDYNKANNNVNNLKWVSHKYNMQDKSKHYHKQYLKNHPNIIETNKSYTTIKCPLCGNPMNKNSQMCSKCRKKRRQNTIGKSKISLKDLQIRLKQANGNFSQVAKDLHVCDSLLHKKLKTYGLPHRSKDYRQ